MRLCKWVARKLHKVHCGVMPRVPELRALEGRVIYTYKEVPTIPAWLSLMMRDALGLDPAQIREVIAKKQLPNGRKLLKALRDLSVPDERIQKLSNILDTKEYPMRLTCAYKSLLRMSVSKHFRTCMAPDGIYKNGPWEIVTKKPTVAIVGCKDKAGDWIARQLVCWNAKHKRLVLSPRVYPKEDFRPEFLKNPQIPLLVPFLVENESGISYDSFNLEFSEAYDDFEKAYTYHFLG